MIQQLEDFGSAKLEIQRMAENLAVWAQEHGRTNLADRASELLSRLATEEFNLAVFGQFERGKSTLINALLGEEILPMGVVPLTSVVTVVRYGPTSAAEVTFKDGRRMAKRWASIRKLPLPGSGRHQFPLLCATLVIGCQTISERDDGSRRVGDPMTRRGRGPYGNH